jgi:phenylacetate-CoA ligase
MSVAAPAELKGRPHSRAWSRKNAWALMPRPARRVVGSMLGVLPQPWILGRGFRNTSAFLEDAQWWPQERSRAYQLEQARALCRVAAKAPFYARMFRQSGFAPDDLQRVEDLRGLPTIHRQTIRENLEAMCAVSPRARGVDYAATGGTSGVPLHFYIGSERSPIEYAYLVSGWRRAGYQLGARLAVFKGDPVAVDRSGLRHEFDAVFKRHLFSGFHMSDSWLGRYVEHLRRIGPFFLHGYPSTIAALTQYAGRAGTEPLHNIRGIIAESEAVYPHQRRDAEAVFGCRYLSGYGQTEKVVSAVGCEHSDAYHVWPTYGVFELIDGNGEPVTTPGAVGEIVGTGFINKVVPFIRYRTGDFARYISDRCTACGREHTLIEEIRGHRLQESLVARDGSFVPWVALNLHDDTFHDVQRLQFYQDTPGRALLRVVPGPGFDDDASERILRNLQRKLAGQLDVTLETVAKLPTSARAKAIYVDQRVGVTESEPGSQAS